MRDNVVIEAKGRFTSQDRKKMLLLKEQHPELKIVMLFGAPYNTLSKKSTTTYAQWCEKNNIEWVDIKKVEALCRLFTVKKTEGGTQRTSRTKKSKA